MINIFKKKEKEYNGITMWLPPKVCTAIKSKEYNQITMQTLKDRCLPNIKRNIALTETQIDKLYNWELAEYYVNWEFICYT